MMGEEILIKASGVTLGFGQFHTQDLCGLYGDKTVTGLLRQVLTNMISFLQNLHFRQ